MRGTGGARRRTPSAGQMLVFGAIAGALAAGLAKAPAQTLTTLVMMAQAAFAATALWRVVLIIASLKRPPPPPEPSEWPRYTVLAALHDEAAVTPQLVRNLSRLDYPADRLQVLLVLEAHDLATQAAAAAQSKPPWMTVHVVPPGTPCTKPRALNHALTQATGELVTIYDAEDDPDPGQLREAAARFVADPRLGCLQAPLRIRLPERAGHRADFLDRQFAFEYAGLFEVLLPGMGRLGLPFPLGGTSNHIRMAALRRTGGWDAFNVTEDADLGFRLWSDGWRLGVIQRPTLETPPGGLDRWLPQRTRWLKGYMQTWGVHTRAPHQLGARGLLSLVMTLGGSITSAAVHAPTLAWLTAAAMIGLHAGLGPGAPIGSLAVLALGVISAWMGCAVGAQRAGLAYRLKDMISAPAYWSLFSLAFVHAAWRLALEPHVWDKTPHDAAEEPAALETPETGREAA